MWMCVYLLMLCFCVSPSFLLCFCLFVSVSWSGASVGWMSAVFRQKSAVIDQTEWAKMITVNVLGSEFNHCRPFSFFYKIKLRLACHFLQLPHRKLKEEKEKLFPLFIVTEQKHSWPLTSRTTVNWTRMKTFLFICCFMVFILYYLFVAFHPFSCI